MENGQNSFSVPAIITQISKEATKAALSDINEFGKKSASYYDSAFSGEYKRLKIQGEALRPSDMVGVNYVREQLKDKKKVYILDVGCGYGVVGRDRFSDFPDKIIVGINIVQRGHGIIVLIMMTQRKGLFA